MRHGAEDGGGAPVILGVIPARGGSRGVPGKNVRLLRGKPLLAYTIREALKSRYLQRLVLTTDDAEIAAAGRRLGAETPFIRPAALAGDRVTDLPVFRHCLEWLAANEGLAPDVVAHLRPTAPLRTVEHIDAGIRLLLDHPEADAVRSVCPVGQHPLKTWSVDGGALRPFVPEDVHGIREAYNRPRQELPAAYVQNGAVDVVRTRVILEERSMTGRVIVPLVMDEAVSVNIDSRIDWRLAEIMLDDAAAAAGEGAF